MILENITIKPFQSGYLEGVVDLLNAELHADKISTTDFQHKVLLDPNFRTEGAPVARYGDRIVGFMLGLTRKHPLEDAAPDFNKGWLTLMAVDKDFQRQGIGSRLLDYVLSYLQSERADTVLVSPYAPNYFLPGVDEAAYPGAIGFLGKHGFSTIYRPLSMEISLIDYKTPNWVIEKERILNTEGILFYTFKPDCMLLLLEHLRLEFPGDWQRLVRETIARIIDGVASSNQLFLAMKDGRSIGFCRHEGERFGPFGVAARERGRGIGEILLHKCLGNMKAGGVYRAWFMWTDDRAAKLYARAGFKEIRRFSVMQREI